MSDYCERLDALAAASGGKLIAGRPEATVRGVFTDTRSPVRGGLFVAIRGERFDGNDYARDAVTRLGAAAVLIDRPDAARNLPPHVGVILVNDSRCGYLGVASLHRTKLNQVLWFGITGSVGKSTTKEMLAHILEVGSGWNVHRAKSSFNNAVGLPHTILGATPQHQAAVLELGTNHPGEIRQLAATARPQIAIVTCAAESHLEAFKTIENVAREKADLLKFQGSNEIAVLNADDPNFDLFRRRALGRVITFGTSPDADISVRRLSIDAEGRARFLMRRGDDIVECQLRVAGAHQAMNAAAAIAAAVAAQLPFSACVRAMNSFEGVARRFAIKSICGITLIDDAYNANPASFCSALATLKSMSAMRKFVVAGDMLELGAASEDYHRTLGRQLADCGINMLVTVGELASYAGEAAVERGLKPSKWLECRSPETAATALAAILEPGDVVLIKGSHGAHLDRCIERLSNDPRFTGESHIIAGPQLTRATA